MGYERKPCEGDIKWHTAGTFSDGYVCEGGFYCRWCGKQRADGWSEPCPEYPFPAFDLVQLMRRLAEEGWAGSVIMRPPLKYEEQVFFDVRGRRPEWTYFKPVSETNDPFGDLCKWLVEKYNGHD